LDVIDLLVIVALPIAPEFVVASNVTATPKGTPFTRELAADVPFVFVAVALNV
jgi:hypothetical protein